MGVEVDPKALYKGLTGEAKFNFFNDSKTSKGSIGLSLGLEVCHTIQDPNDPNGESQIAGIGFNFGLGYGQSDLDVSYRFSHTWVNDWNTCPTKPKGRECSCDDKRGG